MKCLRRYSPDGQEYSMSRRDDENVPSELFNLAGILGAKLQQEHATKAHEALLEKTANEIFNETFESILNNQNCRSGRLQRETSAEKRQRLSIKDRIASIETGEWRFSSDDEKEEPEINDQKLEEQDWKPENAKKLPSPTVVEENFSVKELMSAWEHKENERSDGQPVDSINSMIIR